MSHLSCLQLPNKYQHLAFTFCKVFDLISIIPLREQQLSDRPFTWRDEFLAGSCFCSEGCVMLLWDEGGWPISHNDWGIHYCGSPSSSFSVAKGNVKVPLLPRVTLSYGHSTPPKALAPCVRAVHRYSVFSSPLLDRHPLPPCIWIMTGELNDLCHPYALLRNSPPPVASGTGCYSSNVQRINLTGYSMMLEVRHNLEPRVVILGRRGGEGHPRDSVTALFPPGLSLMSRALHTQHWNHSSSYKLHTSSPSI